MCDNVCIHEKDECKCSLCHVNLTLLDMINSARLDHNKTFTYRNTYEIYFSYPHVIIRLLRSKFTGSVEELHSRFEGFDIKSIIINHNGVYLYV